MRGPNWRAVLLIALAARVTSVGVAWALPLGQGLPGPGSPPDGFYTDAVWSSDGRWIAYSDCSSDIESCGLSIVKRDGSTSRKLTEGSAYARTPAWAPDGRRIAFAGEDDIWIVGTDGTNLRNLTRTAERKEFNPAWSPDGRLIAFVREVRNEYFDRGDIFVMKPSGSGQRNLTRSESSDDTNPVWSPDGRTIAFEDSSSAGSYEILVVAREGGTITDLTHRFGVDEYPAWSPDGRSIAFRSVRSGFNHLFVMNADGRQPRNVTDVRFAADIRELAWSPDGRAIAFEWMSDYGTQDIGVVGTGGHARPRNLTRTPAVNESAPQWSPDGREVLYTANNWGAGVDGVFVMNADGTGKRNLTKAASE